MTEYLKDVEYFASTFGNNDDGNRSRYVYSSGIISRQSGHVNGAIYMLKILNGERTSLFPTLFELKLEGCGAESDAMVGQQIYEFKS